MSTLMPVSPSVPFGSATDVRRTRVNALVTPPTFDAAPKQADPAEQLAQVQQAVERLKQSLKPALANTLQFEIDSGTGRTVVKIIDGETQKLVRQIPSEEVLAITEALDRVQSRGVLVRQQA